MHTLAQLLNIDMATEKSINQFTREMIEVFGIENLAIRLTDADGNLIKKTDNWIDEAEFIRRERQIKQRENEKTRAGGTNGYKRY